MPDFERNIWCLLGLTFDAVDMRQTLDSVRSSVSERKPLFLTTPNLNFLIACQRDSDFRNSVIDSDLSIADGMPLIWIARLLRLPLPERVPGSGMIEQLRQKKSDGGRPIGVYFFGGDEGIAERACRVIARENGGLSCAGHQFPGFCQVGEMSDPETIAAINQANPDFILVALGAKKGQQWIERNRNNLDAPVISHLGAVVNFVAGNVRRAPAWVQSIGFEWVWRILEEPQLWKRYLFDGLGFLKILVTAALPYACWKMFHRNLYVEGVPVTVKQDESNGTLLLEISGDCLHHNLEPLRVAFRDCANRQKSISLDLRAVEIADGAFIGLCMLLWNHQRIQGESFSITGLGTNLKRIFRWNRAEFII